MLLLLQQRELLRSSLVSGHETVAVGKTTRVTTMSDPTLCPDINKGISNRFRSYSLCPPAGAGFSTMARCRNFLSHRSETNCLGLLRTAARHIDFRNGFPACWIFYGRDHVGGIRGMKFTLGTRLIAPEVNSLMETVRPRVRTEDEDIRGIDLPRFKQEFCRDFRLECSSPTL